MYSELFSLLYECLSDHDYENVLKQIMQQIALLGLWRAKFFEYAAFYGGTSLRILYHLEMRLRAFGFYNKKEPLDANSLKKLLSDKILLLDISLAKEDISKFIAHSSRLDGWSKELFLTCVEQLNFI